MVILMVLASMIISLTMSLRMATVGEEARFMSEYLHNRENGYLLARSVAEMSFEVLRQDNGATDSLSDYWALGEMTVQWQGVPVSLRIVDEESKFPLSAMQDNPDDCSYLEEALTRFMELAAVKSGPQAVDQFLDWVDGDSVRRPHGAEEADFGGSVRFKDSPCASIYEVLALPAWEELPHFPNPRKSATASSVGLASGLDLSAEYTESEKQASSAADYDSDNKFGYSGTGKSRFGGTTFNHDVPQGQATGSTSTSPWQEWMSVMSIGKVNINTAPVQI